MQASFIVASPGVKLPDFPSASQQAVETADLLRQLLDVQREQLAFHRGMAMNNDAVARCKRFLDKWQGEFPEIASVTKTVLPAVERMYLKMIEELTEKLNADDIDEFESEYVLGEFLDKYGTRLNQLSTIINQLSPIADAAPRASSMSPASRRPRAWVECAQIPAKQSACSSSRTLLPVSPSRSDLRRP